MSASVYILIVQNILVNKVLRPKSLLKISKRKRRSIVLS